MGRLVLLVGVWWGAAGGAGKGGAGMAVRDGVDRRLWRLVRVVRKRG
ncbi:hypothetical protein [Bartonella sp. ML70XJBT]|nr:hypothetical protein [Bartonella sp. ML70XJBT]